MTRRLLDSAWFLPLVGLALGGLAIAGLTVSGVPSWLRWGSRAMVVLATLGPALPVVALIPWYFVAVRRGLIPRDRQPCTVTLTGDALLVARGPTHTSLSLAEVARARRVCNDNWTESRLLEDALGLFSTRGRELVRVPLSATGVEALLQELGRRGVPIDEVLTSAPAFLD